MGESVNWGFCGGFRELLRLVLRFWLVMRMRLMYGGVRGRGRVDSIGDD